MLDGGEADDKIIAVLSNDPLWASAQDISDVPDLLVERIRHYFMTYKLVPGEENAVTIDLVEGVDTARAIIAAAMADYEDEFGS